MTNRLECSAEKRIICVALFTVYIPACAFIYTYIYDAYWIDNTLNLVVMTDEVFYSGKKQSSW